MSPPLSNAFGIQTFPVLDWSGRESIQASIEKLEQYKGSLIAKDGSSFLFLIQNDPQLSKEEGDSLYEQIIAYWNLVGIWINPFGRKTTRHHVSDAADTFLIVGLSALIHYFTHLIKKLKSGSPKALAIQDTFRELTFAVGLTVFTTSMGVGHCILPLFQL